MHHPSRLIVPMALSLQMLSACALQKKDDAAEYREAVPKAEAVALDDASESSQGSLETQAGTRGVLGAGDVGPARWYVFSRNVRDGINGLTASVLGGVAWILRAEPTEIEDGRAVWGPYPAEPLDPVAYRFTVTRIEDHHYRYLLEGRPKDSSSDADFLPLLDGDGFSSESPEHGDGSFTLDLDNARILDPSRHEDDSGSVRIQHDLPPDISVHLGALPRVITADLTPQTGQWLSITSRAEEDRTGSLSLSGFVDVAEDGGTAPEDVSIESRWIETGAGRADIRVAGGDVPEALSPATAVECWGIDFTRVYYESSFESLPVEGEPSACAYTSAPQ